MMLSSKCTIKHLAVGLRVNQPGSTQCFQTLKLDLESGAPAPQGEKKGEERKGHPHFCCIFNSHLIKHCTVLASS